MPDDPKPDDQTQRELKSLNAELAAKTRDLAAARADLATTRDHLRRVQSQLLQSEKMAALGSMVAGIAHEINTPIGAIASMHDTLVLAVAKLKRTLDKEFPAYATSKKITAALDALESAYKVIESGSGRVSTIVKRLRSFARMDDAERKPANLHEGLEDTLILIHHKTKNRIEITRDYGELPPVSCLPGQINQVFLNILVNAAQAISERGTIKITTRREGDRVSIAIADDGVGIPPENLKSIFEPGFTTKGVGAGTGLGLSICRQIITDHSGEIRVDSAVGEGTTFTILLPINEPDPGSDAA